MTNKKNEASLDNITDTKPEPIASKPNWHYDTYFLEQLKRLNLLKTDSSSKMRRKVNIKPDNGGAEPEIEPESGSESDKKA